MLTTALGAVAARRWLRYREIAVFLVSLVVLVAFYAKWLLLPAIYVPSPLSPSIAERLTQDRPNALIAMNAFTSGFLAAFAACLFIPPCNRRPHPSMEGDPVRLRRILRRLRLLVYGGVALRLLLGLVYGIGVRGDSAALPGTGVLLLVADVLPLVALASMASLERMAARRLASPALVVTLAAVLLGGRSAAILTGLALLLGYAQRIARARRPKPFSGLARILLATALGLAIMGFALAVRPSASTSKQGAAGAVEFALARVGGFEYLAIVAAHTQVSGSDLALVDSTRFNEFMRRDVYRYPSSARTGVSSTAPGWSMSVGGIPATWLLGLLIGVVVHILDSAATLLRTRGAAGRVLSASLLTAGLIAVLNLLLEGTLSASVRLFTAGLASHAAVWLGAVGKWHRQG